MLAVYSDLYYKEKIQPLVNAALEHEPNYRSFSPSERASYQMLHYHRIRAECWADESAEVQAEILRIYDTDDTDRNLKDDDEDDDEENEEDVDVDDDEKSLLIRQQE
jgi:hypothetical protein